MSELKRMSVRTHELLRAVIDESRRQKSRDDAERVLWYELLRTATSLANNSAESDGTQSRPDFVLKFQISLKEARESLQLIRALIHACEQKQQLEILAKNCDEIVAILVTSLKTAKANHEAESRKRRRRKQRE